MRMKMKWTEDNGNDEDKDEIPNYAVILTTSVKIFGVLLMRDFFMMIEDRS